MPLLYKILAANAAIVLLFICGSGLRSSYEVMAFSIMGYRNVKGLALGMREWNAQSFPVVK